MAVGGEEMRIAGGDLGVSWRRGSQIVENPQATAKSGDGEIVAMDHVGDRVGGRLSEGDASGRHRQRREDTRVSSGIEQAFALGVFAHHADPFVCGQPLTMFCQVGRSRGCEGLRRDGFARRANGEIGGGRVMMRGST